MGEGTRPTESNGKYSYEVMALDEKGVRLLYAQKGRSTAMISNIGDTKF